MTFFDDVEDFHEKFGLPHFGDGGEPNLLDDDTLKFRVKFMMEELKEFLDTHVAGDLAGAIDALVDLVYVACGTAHLMHLPFNDAWDEVQRCNMLKVRASGADDPRGKRGHVLDVVKPEGWKPPDHDPIIEVARRIARAGK